MNILDNIKFLKECGIKIDVSLFEITKKEKKIIRIVNLFKKNLEMFDILKNISLKLLLEIDLRGLSSNQYNSKSWLIEEIKKLKISRNSKIIIVGGWCGLLSILLFKEGYYKIMSVDIDEKYELISKVLNKNNSTFKSKTEDMFKINYQDFDLIINTCCEHINLTNWFKLIPNNKMVILQSTDSHYPDHINEVQSLKDFKNQIKFKEIFYENQKVTCIQNNHTRFMIIGKK